MKDFTINNFQAIVNDVLIRHRSTLDILTKLQECTAKVNRAVAKSATYCGCIKLNCEKQDVPEDVSYSEMKDYMSDHIEGELCDICKEKIEKELSANLFYLAALCNVFSIDIEDMLKNHYEQLKTLGHYGLL
ncbi:nucleoside triphosphate pyrophosphohydrolase family protein [Alkaliphilus crotonatoxidans]